MIAYIDTSAIVPLIITEPASHEARQIWREADRVTSARIVYAEARAALAQASRTDRITEDDLAQTVANLDTLYEQLDIVEISDALVRTAGALAEHHGLCGYDSLHLAAAKLIQGAAPAHEDDLVFVAGEIALFEAAGQVGLEVAYLGTRAP